MFHNSRENFRLELLNPNDGYRALGAWDRWTPGIPALERRFPSPGAPVALSSRL